MILWIESQSEKRTAYKIHDFSDFNELAKMFPRIPMILYQSDNLVQAAQKVARYIGHNGRLKSWVDERSVSSIIKKEATIIEKSTETKFSDKFSEWVKDRTRKERQRGVEPIRAIDPGYLHEEDVELNDLKESDDPLDQIRYAIKDAKKQRNR